MLIALFMPKRKKIEQKHKSIAVCQDCGNNREPSYTITKQTTKSEKTSHLTKKVSPQISSEENSENLVPKRAFILIWIVLWIVYLAMLWSIHSYVVIFFSVLVIWPIWLLWDKEYPAINFSSMIKRLKHFRPQYKARTIISVFLILMFCASVSWAKENDEKQRQQEKNNIVTETISKTIEEVEITDTLAEFEWEEIIIEEASIEPTQKDFEVKRKEMVGKIKNKDEYEAINKKCVIKLNTDEWLLFDANKDVIAGYFDWYEMTPYLALQGNYGSYEKYVSSKKFDWVATCILKIDKTRVLEEWYSIDDLEVVKVFKESFSWFEVLKKRLQSIGETN